VQPSSQLPRRRPPASRGRAFLDLLRPANVATAWADVLAGAAVAGAGGALALESRTLVSLLVATTCLYAGGIVLNDVFDRKVDAQERPERPIPSGRVATWEASLLGALLLASGVTAAAVTGTAPGLVAGAIVLAVLSYDVGAKHHPFIGPINMGLCRALNLLLGIAAAPAVLRHAWPLGLLPLIYIAAVTTASRGEVHGARRPVLVAANGLIGGVILALVGLVLIRATTGLTPAHFTPLHSAWAVALAGYLAWRVIPTFGRAARTLAPGDIRAAVRTGVLSLVLLNAVVAASYAGIMESLTVLAIGLLAWGLARLFAVT
jgi:4-hydroxybenzoate polyprenyltransferase